MSKSSILGWTLDGKPFYGFRGAQDDGDAGAAQDDLNTDDGDDGSDDNAPDENGLTPGGRKLIEAEREAAKEAKRALAPWRKLERSFGLTADQIAEKLNGMDDDKTRATRDAEQQVAAKFAERIRRTEVRALARETFVDPDDALKNIDLDAIEVDDEGEVDTKAIERELKKLLQRKPHFAKAAKNDDDDHVTNFDGGARRTTERPTGMMDFVRSQHPRLRNR